MRAPHYTTYPSISEIQIEGVTVLQGTAKIYDFCDRCGGCGNFSFNLLDGTMCYGCSGSGLGKSWDSVEAATKTLKRRVADRVRAERKRQAESDARTEAHAAWVAGNRDLSDRLASLPVDDSFLSDLAAQAGWKPLSEKQTAAAIAVFAKIDTKAAAKADEIANTPAVPEGRLVIEGEVVGIKQVVDTFSYYERHITKMVVRSDEGFKIYGTMPSSISAERGDRVRFTATVEQSRDDSKFGFFKRPTKATVLTTEEVTA